MTNRKENSTIWLDFKNQTKGNKMDIVKVKSKELQVSTKLLKSIEIIEYIDEESGEVEEMQHITLQDKDFNFEKIWLMHLFQSLQALGNKKLIVALYLMSIRDKDNMIYKTYEEMRQDILISRGTIIETIKILENEDFIKKIRNGKYQINPNIIFKGDNKKRMNVMMTYQKEEPKTKMLKKDK